MPAHRRQCQAIGEERREPARCMIGDPELDVSAFAVELAQSPSAALIHASHRCPRHVTGRIELGDLNGPAELYETHLHAHGEARTTPRCLLPRASQHVRPSMNSCQLWVLIK
ncbi:MAG TPA: hypothetical protein VKM54_19470 [Myxococcota bacterium]|nr:hypothetical protein [Myxococcota bacterium]